MLQPEILTLPACHAAPASRRSALRHLIGLGCVIGAGTVPALAFVLPSVHAPSAQPPAPPTPIPLADLRPQLPAPPPHAAADTAGRAAWQAFQARFIAPEGRVVDTANGNVSHSEGQGYAMLLAEWANDRAAFERLWNWTRDHLSRPSDRLIAWRWIPGQTVNVPDTNNATDGDIAIAWALLRASERWSVPQWREHAAAMTRDLLITVVRKVAQRTVLLPACWGFTKPDHVVVNPSYYNFPAIRALATLVPDPAWRDMHDDGLALINEARFGLWGLPSDWIDINSSSGRLQPAAGWPARFSWDAIRIPLFLAWAGEHGSISLQNAARFWTNARPGSVPAWTDLRSNALAPYPGHAGIVAIAALSASTCGVKVPPSWRAQPSPSPDYYSAALVLLAQMAAQENATQSRVMAMAQR